MAIADSFGTAVAPHDPSGPVSAAATAHVGLASATPPIVEFAWGEAPWRSALVGGAEVIEAGSLVVSERPGLGLVLDEVLAAEHPFVETPVGPDLWDR
jgi:galactonate dehydratase